MPSQYPSHPPYIPIIKWQKAEQKALSAIGEELIEHVWPCIEVRGVTYHELLMSEVYHYWKGTALVDYANPSGRLDGRRMKEFESFLTVAGDKTYPIIPVIDSRDALELNDKMQQLLSTFETVVVRLRAEGLTLSQVHFDQAGSAFSMLSGLNVSPLLMVDLGESPTSWTPEVLQSFAGGLQKLKAFGYTTVHLTSGAYPQSLVDVATMAEYDRNDWKLWKELNAVAPELTLGYSDYGILSPKWTEDILKKIAKKVAIRYTRAKDWLILKATGKRKQDSINLSVILVNTYADDFMGPQFSLGDRQMAIRADESVPDRNKKSGASSHLTEAWIHHIAYVVKEQY
ncbi:beta family protein [Pseudomonas sp. PHC1]|uniref:beta family protein n=1 Tax=Pseudomonas sp. PHC1 TaxID=3384759 RepID=UPI00396F6333